MANLNKKEITVTIRWSRDAASDLSYDVTALAEVDDDSEAGGKKIVGGQLRDVTMTRAQFRGLTGAQIEAQILAKSNEALQTIGSGAGAHVIADDVGDLP